MFPHMVLIHNQEYNSQRLEDVEKEFEKGFESLRLSAEEIRGKKIGIAVGSRRILQNLALLARRPRSWRRNSLTTTVLCLRRAP